MQKKLLGFSFMVMLSFFAHASTADAGVRSLFKKMFKKEAVVLNHEEYKDVTTYILEYPLYEKDLDDSPEYCNGVEGVEDKYLDDYVARYAVGVERHTFKFEQPIFPHFYLPNEAVYLKLRVTPYWNYAVNLKDVTCVIEVKGHERKMIPISNTDYRILPGDIVDVGIKYVIPALMKDTNVKISVLYKSHHFSKNNECLRMVDNHEDIDVEIASPIDTRFKGAWHGFCMCEDAGYEGERYNRGSSSFQDQKLAQPTQTSDPKVVTLDSQTGKLEVSITPGAYLNSSTLHISHPSFHPENILEGREIFKLKGKGAFVSHAIKNIVMMPKIVETIGVAEGSDHIFLKIPAGIYGGSAGHKVVYQP